MTTAEVAWAAGLFEGEGCIHVGGAPHGNYALVLRTTDLDVLQRFVGVVGVGTIHTPRRYADHHKQAYEWRLTLGHERHRVLRMLYPYLGARRRAKADEMLAIPVRRPGGLTRQERRDRGMVTR